MNFNLLKCDSKFGLLDFFCLFNFWFVIFGAKLEKFLFFKRCFSWSKILCYTPIKQTKKFKWKSHNQIQKCKTKWWLDEAIQMSSWAIDVGEAHGLVLLEEEARAIFYDIDFKSWNLKACDLCRMVVLCGFELESWGLMTGCLGVWVLCDLLWSMEVVKLL